MFGFDPLKGSPRLVKGAQRQGVFQVITCLAEVEAFAVWVNAVIGQELGRTPKIDQWELVFISHVGDDRVDDVPVAADFG